jgi:hypothetical protein
MELPELIHKTHASETNGILTRHARPAIQGFATMMPANSVAPVDPKALWPFL